MGFDVDGALKAGYSYGDIANELARHVPRYNLNAARKSGVSDEQSARFLAEQLKGFNPMEAQSAQSFDPSKVDKESGGSYINRLLVGSAADEKTKRERLHALYGEQNVRVGGNGEFIVSKDGKNWKQFNPEGFDIGDIFGGAREIVSAGASIPAGLLGGIAGGGVGSLLTGSAAGAAGGAAAGQGFDTIAANITRAISESRRQNGDPTTMNPVQSPLDAAKEFGLETAFGTVGGAALGGAGRLAHKALNPFQQPIVEAARKIAPLLGKNPNDVASVVKTVGTAVNNKPMHMAERALGGSLGSSGTMEVAAKGQDKVIRDATEAIAKKMLTNGEELATSPESLGEILTSRLGEGNRIKREYFNKLYDDFFGRNGNVVLEDIPSVWAWQKELLSQFQEGKPTWRAMLKRTNDMIPDSVWESGSLTANELRYNKELVHDAIGEILAKTVGNNTPAERYYIGLIHAMEKDTENAIKEQLGQKALDEYLEIKAADTIRHNMSKALNRFKLKDVSQPEAYENGKTLLNKKLSGEQARALKYFLTDEGKDVGWNQVRAGIFNMLDTPTSEAVHVSDPVGLAKNLSGGRFGWNKEALEELFGKNELIDALRTIAHPAAAAREVNNSSNTAFTANSMKIMQMLPALSNPYLIIQTIGGPALVSKVMTSPKVINYLAKKSAPWAKKMPHRMALTGATAGRELGRRQ